MTGAIIAFPFRRAKVRLTAAIEMYGQVERATSSRLLSIDLLRGSAALAVVIDHAIRHGPQLPGAAWFSALFAVLSQGHLGVPLFFAISGFCIHLRWARQSATSGRDEVRFVEFWKRRVYRLYPAYVIVLCLSMGMVLWAYLSGTAPFLLAGYPQPRGRWIGIDFGTHLAMLHGLHPVLDRAGGNPPFWTLAREEYLYLMYFGLLASRRLWGVTWSAVGVLVLGLAFPLLMLPFLPPASRWWYTVDYSAVVLWIQWCLGMVAVEAFVGLRPLPAWCRAPWLVLGWAAAALVAEHVAPPLVVPLWGMTFFTLVNYCVALEASGCWPERRIVAWLSRVGVFSYSLYLVHHPVQVVTEAALRRAWPVAATDRSALGYLAMSAALVVASYYAARLFFALVERHFLKPMPARRK